MRVLLIFCALCCFPLFGMGQGCSDAGFCTMGAMRPDQPFSKVKGIKLRSVELLYYEGSSLVTARIKSVTLDFNFAINSSSSFQVKAPYQWVSGNLGELGGLGDISLSYTKNLKNTVKWNISGSLGAKIPSTDGNKTVNNKNTEFVDSPIHMYYQTSLGSYDAIAGISALSRNWLLATGIQIALTSNNNQFTWEQDNNSFPGYPSQSYLQEHNVGRELKRGIDIMFRAERNWRFAKFNFSVGALPIWRITKDEGIPVGETERQKLDGTTGLALSVLVSAGYQFNVKHGVKLIYGEKILDRDFNPDGLTRNDVVNIGYLYKF